MYCKKVTIIIIILWAWNYGHEGERNNNCSSKIQQVGQNIHGDKTSSTSYKLDFFLPPKHYKYGRRFSLLVGYNI